ncbi:rRNA pseudouridine synthase [Candidatus Saccharibacteria bacterium]|nr:rRNA pseudouridine synthase [Candidatus Saccharibacteria bacterium]
MLTQNTRLNKHLALQLGISRREADDLIASGTVTVNDQIVSLGARVLPQDVIMIAGAPVDTDGVSFRYIALNKPVGYVCSKRKQGQSDTIYSLLPPELRTLKSVGRLDRNSSGLLLLTNDGDFTQRMTHPSYKKTKVYHVRLDHDLEPLHQQMISDFGIQLDDGHSQLSLAKMSEHNRTEWQVTMAEGRNRQIRRTFAALGYNVTRLHRVQFGNYSLGEIPRGTYKIINIS